MELPYAMENDHWITLSLFQKFRFWVEFIALSVRSPTHVGMTFAAASVAT